MADEQQVKTAYRAMIVAALNEARARGDEAAQRRIQLMLELHDTHFPVAAKVKDSLKQS